MATFLMFTCLGCFPLRVGQRRDHDHWKVRRNSVCGGQGKQPYTSGAKILASGPVKAEAEASGDGKYVFVELPPGTTLSKLPPPGLRLYRRSLSRLIR